jgi:glucose/arabinose dehydrogenase
MRLPPTVSLIVLTLLLAAPSGAAAATLQPVGDFEEPIFVTSDPGNPDRLFVVERRGRVERVEGGTVSLFVDLRSQVGCGGGCGGERGLLSIALAPDFDASGRLYVDYANDGDGTIHVDELTAGPGHLSASASSLRPLLSIPHPGASNHNGGQLQFGPEGDLFASTGDGGGSNDEFHNAQDLTKPLGKLLRIQPDPAGPPPFYRVPADNPFAGVGGDYGPIWSYGLRNPFRFSFDRLSGNLVIADVGQNAREEVDLAPAPGLGRGNNYGWNCREGLIAGPATDPQCGSPTSPLVSPVFDYTHTPDPDLGGEDRCAIIGGYVVRDSSLGSLYGRYLYGDLCNGDLRSLDLTNPFASDRTEHLMVPNLNSFGEDSCGRVYAVSGDGPVSRLVGSAPAVCAQPVVAPTRAPARARISAAKRRVRRGRRARIRVSVAPCAGRAGEPLVLLRGGHRVGERKLGARCVARFEPRIRHRSRFRARVPGDASYLPATSRRLVIRLARRAGRLMRDIGV